jgi:tRNA modification GTPase
MVDDTIIAVSTPPGRGGLGVLRLSGKGARRLASRLFKPRAKAEAAFPPRRAVLGDLMDPEAGVRLDEAVLVFFPARESYTREDLVEISCHGSPVILERAVRIGIKAGARHAFPGEFTRRAFLGGRIDIIQAQAVNDLVMARSLEQAKISVRQLGGSLSRRIASVRARIVDALTLLETSIEFPDEGISIPPARIARALGEASADLKAIVGTYDSGKTLLEGSTVVITGRPNVGKSTLFNSLLEEDRAIVAPYPGTTRDFLRESLRIGDSHFALIDTAGLSASSHPVEKEGRERGRKLIAGADGVLVLLDASRPLTSRDFGVVRSVVGKRAIVVLNKADLGVRADVRKLEKETGRLPRLAVSALRGTNIGRLKRLIKREFAPEPEPGREIILHLHQKLLLEEVEAGVERARKALGDGLGEELCAEEIRAVLPAFGRLTGEIRNREVINAIFSRFCVGK